MDNDIIVTTITLNRDQVFNRMIELLIAADWEQLNASPDPGAYILHSTGISGNRHIYIQLDPCDRSGTYSASYDSRSLTTRNTLSINSMFSYVPSETLGSLGTFNPNHPWITTRNWVSCQYLHANNTISQQNYELKSFSIQIKDRIKSENGILAGKH